MIYKKLYEQLLPISSISAGNWNEYCKAATFSFYIWPTNPQSINYKFWNLVLPIFWTSSFHLEVYCGKQTEVPYLVSILPSGIVNRLINSHTQKFQLKYHSWHLVNSLCTKYCLKNKTTYLVTYIICNRKFKQLAKLVHFSVTQNVREITINNAYI